MAYLTNEERTDGFGAQFQSVLWSFLYTELTDKPYVYTDIKHIDLISNCGSIKDTECENTLEEAIDYMGFNKYYTNSKNISGNIEILKYTTAYKYIETNMEYVFRSHEFQKYKQFFYNNKINRFNNDFFNVAIHIRRLGHWETENNRFMAGRHDVPNQHFLNIIKMLRAKYNNKKLLFHIYSQGDIIKFQEFISDDIVLHLNEKILDTFTDLIYADVLVTCRSSFSYLAALLSNNVIYYLPFWHPPLNHWNILN